MKKAVLFVAIGLCSLGAFNSADAASIAYNLNVSINGDLPQGLPTATILDTAVNTVQLTMDLTGTPTAQFTDVWLFNFSGTQAALDALSFTYEAGLSTGPAATIGTTLNAFGNNNTPGFGASSSGLFDIQFEFPKPQASRFNGGEKVVYTITGSGLSTGSFNVPSASPFNAQGPYFTAADFQGIPDANSGVLGANTAGVVPEPSSIIVLGSGLVGLSAFGLRRYTMMKSRA